MIQRFVCFEFKSNTPPEAIHQHMAMFAALPAAIPQIVSYAGGRVTTSNGAESPYDCAHYVTFKSQADLDTYYHHEAHQQFIQANRDQWENVLVVDSEIANA